MKLKSFTLWSALALLMGTTACQKQSPAAPTTTSTGTTAQTAVTDAKTGVTLTTPTLTSPADGTTIANVKQPVTLVIGNSVTTSTTPLVYSFEVATDAGFANKAYAKDNVPEGANGQTSLTIDKIGPGQTYYWRAHTVSGSIVGPSPAPKKFIIGPQVILQTPVLSDPGANATVSQTPTLTVNNVQRSGPVDKVFYRFEVSQTSDFGSLAFVATVQERTDVPYTQANVTTKLNPNSTYWWRVQASDPTNQVTTAYSGANPFKVAQPFDFSKATFWDNPPDVNLWPATATITLADTSGDFIIVDFDRRLNNPWPSVGFGTGDLQYTLGMCFNLSQQWNCSAAIQFWYGRDLEAGGHPWEVGINWYYDHRWGAMMGHQPDQGEIVGIWVGAGNLRDSGNVIAKERSDVVMMPFGSRYTNGAGVMTPMSMLKLVSPVRR